MERYGGTARGGRSIYGFSLGILMLDTYFPRIPGDIGNALTWDFPVLYKVVSSAGSPSSTTLATEAPFTTL